MQGAANGRFQAAKGFHGSETMWQAGGSRLPRRFFYRSDGGEPVRIGVEVRGRYRSGVVARMAMSVREIAADSWPPRVFRRYHALACNSNEAPAARMRRGVAARPARRRF